MWFLRQLFCKHKWRSNGTEIGYSIAFGEAEFSRFICRRCGKVERCAK